MRTITLLLALGVVAGEVRAQARASSPPALIRRAVEAIGGEAALRGLRNKAIEFHSASFGLGQEETPGSPPRATLSYGGSTTDYAGGRMLVQQEVRVVTGQINRQRQIIRAGMGLTDNNGNLSLAQPAAVAAALRGMSLQPERLLLAALENPGGLSPLRPGSFRGETLDGVRLALPQDTLNLWFDRPTGRLTVSEVLTDDGVLGDRRTLTWYTRWQDAGGLMLPRQFDTEVNGRLLSNNVVTSITLNQPLDESAFVIPDSLVARAPTAGPAGPPPVTVNLVELAPGVWRAEGGSHHSLVVDQGRTLLVVEAPQSAARSKAVLDTLRRRFPDHRVSAVVATHHHHDHSGGLREYMARNIPVIAHSRNVAFVRGIALARKTVAPDALSRTRRAPLVRGVGDSLALGQGAGQVVLYPLESAHAEGILGTWVPSARIVFTSDVLSPAAGQPPARPGSAELAAFARRYRLEPARFAGGHGAVIEWSAVAAAAR